MTEHEPSLSAALAARIVEALMDAGLLDARFEDEAIRVVAGELAGEADRTPPPGRGGDRGAIA